MTKVGDGASSDGGGVSGVEDGTAVDSGLVSLVMLAQFFEKPADPAQLAHDYAPDGVAVDEVQLLRAAKSLGFKAKAMDLPASRLDKAPLPVIGQWVDEEIEVEVEAPPTPPEGALPPGAIGQIGMPPENADTPPETITKTVTKPCGFFILAKSQTARVPKRARVRLKQPRGKHSPPYP